jgi:hypothetical protein
MKAAIVSRRRAMAQEPVDRTTDTLVVVETSAAEEQEPAVGKPQTLTHQELIDLFKHWDTRVAHQENIFTPTAAAPVVAVIASWEHTGVWIVMLGAVFSLAVYWAFLAAIDRIAVFQDNIFAELTLILANFRPIIDDPRRRLGVRRLRILGLPFLAATWASLTIGKALSETGSLPYAVPASVLTLVVSAVLCWQLWTGTTPEN